MKNEAQRVGVFVDVQNMYYSARALYDQRVDFGEILKEAVGNRKLVRAMAYVIKAEKEDEKTFFDALEERGYELRSKELLTFYGGHQKGDWDVGLSMDVVRLAPKLDVVVIVSGDGDFADLVTYVKSMGCRAEAIAFGSSSSSQLREVVDSFFDMSTDTKRFLIEKRGRSKSTSRPAQTQTQKPAPATQKPGTTVKASPAARPTARRIAKPAARQRPRTRSGRTPRITT
ncbi:MAG: NYN domain-containing protein [Candidatus Kerfeldbacteria bacterium]